MAEVTRAARATLADTSTVVDGSVTGPGAEYSLSGRVVSARGRYRARVRFSRDPREGFPGRRFEIVGEIVGQRAEAYVAPADRSGLRGRRCWLVPHLPIGSAPRIASAEEALALLGMVTRLLAEATERARIDESAEEGHGATRYEAWVDPSAARRLDRPRGGRVGTRPRQLANDIDLPLTVEAVGGRLSRLSLELSDYEPAAFRRRFEGAASVQIDLALAPSDNALKRHRPDCLAIE